MSVNSFEELSVHSGHEIEVVLYGKDEAENAACECLTCGEVLIDFDKDGEDDG